MKSKVRFYKTGHAFFSKSVADSGYIGDLDTIANAVTITVIKPNTNLEDVKRSLEITIQDIELRIRQEKKEQDIVLGNGKLIIPRKSDEVKSFVHAAVDLDLDGFVQRHRPGYILDWAMVEPYGEDCFEVTRIGVKPKGS